MVGGVKGGGKGLFGGVKDKSVKLPQVGELTRCYNA